MRDLTQRCDDVWVVTGPLYLPQRAPTLAAGGPSYIMQHPMLGALLPACMLPSSTLQHPCSGDPNNDCLLTTSCHFHCALLLLQASRRS